MDEQALKQRIQRLKRFVPKGMIKVEKVEPVRGLVLEPLSAKELGLPERKAA